MRWDPGQTICFCHNVPYKDIEEAIQSGAKTLKEIQDRTCASTGCGGCESEVLEILEVLKTPASAQETG